MPAIAPFLPKKVSKLTKRVLFPLEIPLFFLATALLFAIIALLFAINSHVSCPVRPKTTLLWLLEKRAMV